MRPVSWLALFAVACNLATASAVQQTAPAPSVPTFTSGVNLLRFDVSVLDKDRRPVRGLSAGDFTVRANGRALPVVAFTRVDVPEAASTADAALADGGIAPAGSAGGRSMPLDAEGRLVVVLFDRVPQVSTVAARAIGRAAIRAMGPADVAAVMAVGASRTPEVSSDRARLLAVVDGPIPFMAAGDAAVVENQGGCYCGTCLLDSIAAVADGVRGFTHRRKTLILVSRMVRLQAATPECAFPMKLARERAYLAIDRANLTIQTLDPTSLLTRTPDASTPGTATQLMNSRFQADTADTGRQLSLGVLPERTGGRAVTNTNAPEKVMAAIFAESASYYLLGVEWPSGLPRDKDMTVAIRVRGDALRSVAQRLYVPDARLADAETPSDPVSMPAASSAAASVVKAWTAAVAVHVPGHVDASITEMSSWSARDLTSVVDTVARMPAAYAPAALIRGAMLHTDVAVAFRDGDGYGPLATTRTVVQINDGRQQTIPGGTIHWDVARRLLDALSEKDAVVRTWYEATSAVLEGWDEYSELDRHLVRGRQLFPDDARLWLYTGTMHESYASARIQNALVPVRALPMTFSRMGAFVPSNPIAQLSHPASLELSEAEEALRKALSIDPALSEARLRLGQVLGTRGRHEEARMEIVRALDTPPASRDLHYDAWLLLGREETALGHAGAARDAFERAAALFPSAQSPRLAASQLMRAAGNRTSAQQVLAVLGNGEDPAANVDPWWTYSQVHEPSGMDLLALCRRMVDELPR